MESFDRTQAEYLVYTYSDLILRLSYTYLKSTHDAEDICQTVFLKYLTAGQTFRDREHEKAWIIRTAVNACKDVLKSGWRTRTCNMEACAEVAAPEMRDDSLMTAVQSLPDKYRIPLYLHYYEGYKTYEIAEMLGERPATINTHIDRARGKLRTILGGKTCEQGV